MGTVSQYSIVNEYNHNLELSNDVFNNFSLF